jgi:hypothetical protein
MMPSAAAGSAETNNASTATSIATVIRAFILHLSVDQETRASGQGCMMLHQMDAVEGENVPEEKPKGLGRLFGFG